MSKIVRISDHKRVRDNVYFSRSDLSQLISVYSRKVICGEWKDYAIDCTPGRAAFSIFRDGTGRPVYTVIKLAGGRRADGEYLLLQGAITLRHGRTLGEVLSVFDRHLTLVSS